MQDKISFADICLCCIFIKYIFNKMLDLFYLCWYNSQRVKKHTGGFCSWCRFTRRLLQKKKPVKD